ncbi:DNA ligase [Cohnella sp. LGH]|uniref:ATP-dependent DNA ligase n=1 Tax=Cohnella sp. LGH TaxID=1619153 RepID=UPI001ADD619A|nr:RNA ligase family protein [Cohnella sp. LGH]QTH44982.1 DNA ligase [Cohnella sp. LGH]
MKPIIPFEPVRSDSVPKGRQWIYQVKWDGVRILSYFDGAKIRLYNRHLNERTMQFPELTDPSYCSASSFILDGEVIALAADGKPSFHEVMRRDGIRRPENVSVAQKEVSITYMIFDIVYLNGEWLNNRPLSDRLELLQEFVIPTPSVQLVASHPDGESLFRVVEQNGMEGIVCKDRNSTYEIGRKDGRWVKVKNYGDVVAVIGGYTMRGGVVNAVLAGLYSGGKLYFIGKVGTGKLTAADWREITKVVAQISTLDCPFANRHPDMRGAHWCKPILTAKIQYTEWRWQEGRTMRQPSIQAFVTVPPHECTFA